MLKPIKDSILVRRNESKETVGSLYIPEAFRDQLQFVTVLAKDENSEDPVVEYLEAGETLLISKFGGTFLDDNQILIEKTEVLGSMHINTLFPSGRNLLVKMDPPENTKGSLYIPDSAQEETCWGTVKRCGFQCSKDFDGKNLKGKRVFITTLQGTQIEYKGEDYVIVDERKVKAYES